MATPLLPTITQVVTRVITETVTAAATPSSTLRASPQGGILEGSNPSIYDPKNPIFIFIIQAGIILTFCRLLYYPLSKLGQPRVIAEVIGGILLGPSVFGHVPGFTNTIFPAASIPTLTLVANLGLVLFLFLVGLEVDLRFFMSNWRIAVSVGALGMALPFGLGAAISYGLYNQFRDEPGTTPVSLGVYMLFIGVAMAITAFPVLCRILTELKLLNTPVGIIVLSAGVGNDVVGWVLLALCVALVNASSGLTAVWVLLVCVGYTLFLVFAVRPSFLWVLQRSGSLQNGPTQSMVALTLLMALLSAFFTGIIGVHPIFGGFVIGLICPHEGGFAIKVTEKVEDLISVLFLPLYFALSGLSTNLGLLNTGITWAYVIGVISVAFFAKIIGGTIAARFNGLVWRESFTIGVLMSCKGLIELIVLNIGLQADILSTRTFTIFVVMALVTTCSVTSIHEAILGATEANRWVVATTPLTTVLYPPWYQIKIEAWKRGEIDWEGNRLAQGGDSGEPDEIDTLKRSNSEVTRLLLYLRFDSMPGVLALVSLLAAPVTVSSASRVHYSKQESPDNHEVIAPQFTKRPQVHGIRLKELTDRASSVMKVTELEESAIRDPIVNTVRTFGRFRNLQVSGEVMIVPETAYATSLVDKASSIAADMMIIPWSISGHMSEYEKDISANRFANGPFSQFVLGTLGRTTCNTAIFIDEGLSNKNRGTDLNPLTRTLSALSARNAYVLPIETTINAYHIFLPLLGSEDDKVALRFVLQLAQDTTVTASIVQFELSPALLARHQHHAINEQSTSRTILSDISDGPSVGVTTQALVPDHYSAFFSSLHDSLPSSMVSRVVFRTVHSDSPNHDILASVKDEMERISSDTAGLVVLGRNVALDAAFSHGLGDSVSSVCESEANQALGIAAGGILDQVPKASLLVVRSVG